MKKHDCKSNLILNGKQEFDGDYFFCWGECEVCGKKLVETFKYVDTRNSETDEIIN